MATQPPKVDPAGGAGGAGESNHCFM